MSDPMTTTDPTPLAEQIAREHVVDPKRWECLCGGSLVWGDFSDRNLDYAAHIATVTEHAVRERIAAEIEAFEPEDRALVHMPDWREAMEGAADIARGAPDTAPWNHPGHKPVQHRDRQPPWCRECGWTSPQAAVPARQIKTGAPDA